MGKQFKLFIVEPLSKIIQARPTVIVIDRLDECGDEIIRMDALRAIAEASEKLSSAINSPVEMNRISAPNSHQ
jgi:hypothetical protein